MKNVEISRNRCSAPWRRRPKRCARSERASSRREAELEAATQLRQAAAEIIMQSPAGLELRRMQMITEVGR